MGSVLSALLGPEGPLVGRLEGYQPRAGQVDMALAVERALDEDRLVLCEAGTGTGKTLAYLVPALRAGRRVVVSTASRALQEQIAHKDVPIASACVERRVVTRVVKGLSNYLCRRRFAELRLGAVDPSEAVRRALPLVERWASVTALGDVAELDGLAEDHPIWREVTSSSETRLGARCPHHEDCHVTRMKRNAEEAELLVVNHHLLVADLAIRGDHPARVLPDYDALIIDEAHKLEEIATRFFGARFSAAALHRALREAQRGSSSLLAEAAIDKTERLARELFAALNLVAPNGDRVALPEVSAGVRDAHHALDDQLDLVARRVAEGEAAEGTRAHVVSRIDQLRDHLARILDDDPHRVAWLERGRGLSLSASPIDVGPELRERLWSRGHAIVLTSASLATGGDFAFIRSRLGIDEELVQPVDELVVRSSIDPAVQALLYAPADLPEVDDPTFADRAAERLAALFEVTPGGAFVLCTSNRSLRALAPRLARLARRPVLSQGDGPKSALLQRFREAGDAVLVATMSFWEGVDVPGAALRLVAIDRLPFPVPSDPIHAARAASLERRGASAFRSDSLPRAAITLKQGFGRLLRGPEDRGVVAVLDRRLVERRYGTALLESLPPMRLSRELEDVVAFWHAEDEPPWDEAPP
ncbi:MAG: ATP-dependent DNA helicase [Polyangiaceae bacterium]